MVIQHERQGNFVVGDDSKVFINTVDYKRPQGRGKGFMQNSGSKKVCTYCGKTSHTMDQRLVIENMDFLLIFRKGIPQ